MRPVDFDRARRGFAPLDPETGHAAAACALAQEDRAALAAWLDLAARHDPWVTAVARAKLALARVFAAADRPDDRVGLGTRFAFGLGDRPVDSAVLAPWDEEAAPLGRIALRTRLGIAAFGMREGAETGVPRHDGTIERLVIHGVLYQSSTRPLPAVSPANDNRGSDREVWP